MVQRIDTLAQAQFRFQSLGDLLAFQTPFSFRSYGSGQLSVVSARGTSANHTAVLWNGININQPTLGQTDFSSLPVAALDRVAVQFGSSGSTVGSEAVGASILLNTQPHWDKPGLNTRFGGQLASFGNRQSLAGIRFTSPGKKDWQLETHSLYYQFWQPNRYPYTERRYYFMEATSSGQRGFRQDVFLRNARQQQWGVNLWLSENDQVLLPNDPISREQTRSQSARFLTTYENQALTLRAGWIRDMIDYSKGTTALPDHSVTDRLLTKAEYESVFILGQETELRLRVGGEISHYIAQVDGYDLDRIRENRGDLYALVKTQWRRLSLSTNVRQAFITRFDPPLAPSVGLDYRLWSQKHHTLTFRSALARSYRVPTLNARYWRQLSNPDLKPENGLNAETGLSLRLNPSSRLALTTDLTVYRNRIRNWTYWNPELNYRVENLQQVLARGLEWHSSLTYQVSRWQSGLSLRYAFTKSTQERAYNQYASDVIGRQLPYVPFHTGTLGAFVQYRTLRLTVLNQASSRRYITFDNSQFLRGYVLTNVILESRWKYRGWGGHLQAQLNNALDVLYLSVKRNALPGRNLSMQCIINLNE